MAAPRTALALLFFPILLLAQTPNITLASVNLSIDPTNTDSYSIQGVFSGLAFANAQNIILSVGQFVGELAITDLAQQPGTNIYTYQDSTGLTPFWLSGLTLDLDAQTFTATATGIVLAGLPNPFAVQLGTDSVSACTMARVQSAGQSGAQTTWQLTAGDGAQEPCAIPIPPLAFPPAVPVNTPTNVQFQVAIQPTANLDPTTVQLFQADTNGQPSGAPLCTLQDNGLASNGDDVAGDGVYSCIASFAASNPGLIPLLVQASAAPNALLSPGFSVLAVQPVSQADVDALSAVNDAANSAWEENYAAYGDSAQARVQTLNALRTAGLSGVARIGLQEDGLSIGVLLTSGLPYSLILNQIDNGQSGATQPPSIRARPNSATAIGPRAAHPSVSTAGTAGAASPPMMCGAPQRPVVKDNKVIVWKSPFFPEPTAATLVAQQFQAIGCPNFQVDQVDATIANAMNFPNYGTVIIDTHGGVNGGDVGFLTSEPARFSVGDPKWDMAQHGLLGAASFPGLNGFAFFTLNSEFFKSLGPFENTITFAAACWSAYGNVMADIFAANGGAYYGFTRSVKGTTIENGATVPGFSELVAQALFPLLLNRYENASDAYQGVPHVPAPAQQLSGDERIRKIEGANYSTKPKNIVISPNPRYPLFVLQPAGSQLAYLGNPVLSATGQSQDIAYIVLPGQSLGLQATLDGASSCAGAMSYQWTNTAMSGHLTPTDAFTDTDSSTVYTASNSQGTDAIRSQFIPNPGYPPAAQACTAAEVTNQQMVRVVFDGQGTSSDTGFTGFNKFTYTADVSWHAAWDVTIPDPGVGFGGSNSGPSLPGTTVTGTTSVLLGSGAINCSGPPVANPNHGYGSSPVPQSPFIGIRADFSDPSPPGVVPMWVETFGGSDYDLCDGLTPMATGLYGTEPGYPGLLPSHAMFNLDLSEWYGQPDHTTVIPVSGSFSAPYDPSLGPSSAQWSGALTLTSRNMNAGNSPPTGQSRAATSRATNAPPGTRRD